MMAQLATALAHVHSHGIIHRDVKPGHCLICLAAEVLGRFLWPNLVLADFGMARRVSADPPRRRLDARPDVKPGRLGCAPPGTGHPSYGRHVPSAPGGCLPACFMGSAYSPRCFN